MSRNNYAYFTETWEGIIQNNGINHQDLDQYVVCVGDNDKNVDMVVYLLRKIGFIEKKGEKYYPTEKGINELKIILSEDILCGFYFKNSIVSINSIDFLIILYLKYFPRSMRRDIVSGIGNSSTSYYSPSTGHYCRKYVVPQAVITNILKPLEERGIIEIDDRSKYFKYSLSERAMNYDFERKTYFNDRLENSLINEHFDDVILNKTNEHVDDVISNNGFVKFAKKIINLIPKNIILKEIDRRMVS